MGRISRHEFLGSRIRFMLMCFTGIGIPIAVLYLLECLVTIEEDIESPREFLETYKKDHKRGWW